MIIKHTFIFSKQIKHVKNDNENETKPMVHSIFPFLFKMHLLGGGLQERKKKKKDDRTGTQKKKVTFF
jgi:hypothetical protein